MKSLSRRHFVTATACFPALRFSPSFALDTNSNSTDLCSLSATEAVRAMQRGEIKAETYASALLARCRALTDLNAFISIEPEAVLEAARAADQTRAHGVRLGALHGLPIPVKDCINSAQLPTTSGTASLRTFRPALNASALELLIAEGAIVLGKTNLHELGLGVTSNNLTYGACRNPYDPSRIPGGSSGGSAVAVAARMAPLAVGEDTTCSIRIPAALCGVAGLRPTTGRYPSDGVMPITPRFDTLGPIARSVECLSLFDRVLHKESRPLPKPSLRTMRLGVPGDYWDGLDSETERVGRAALDRLKDAGVSLVRFDLPGILKGDLISAIDIVAYEVVANQTRYLQQYSAPASFEQFLDGLSLPVRSRYEKVFLPGARDAIDKNRHEQALKHIASMRDAMRQVFREQRLAAIVFPPALIAAVPIGVEGEIDVRGEKSTVRTAMLRNTVHTCCIGMPGLVLPAGLTSSGLPVGLEFDMLPGDDLSLLSAGTLLERTLGTVSAPAGLRS